MASLADVESIDKLTMPVGSEESRRADYFLDNRRVIVELKSLETDPNGKIDVALEKRREDDDFPLFYGQANLMEVLGKLRDGEQLKERIADLAQQRAAFDRVPFAGNDDIGAMDQIKSLVRTKKTAGAPSKRHEKWRAEYKARSLFGWFG